MYMFCPAPLKPRTPAPHTRLAGSCTAAALRITSSKLSAGLRPFAS